MWTTLPSFYNSVEWKTLRGSLIADRLNEEGQTICAECGKPIVNAYDCIAHHVKPLTMQNVNDYSVSLNPKNILLVHMNCHNVIHGRFGYTAQRKVYYVYGSPFSGKSSWVQSVKGNSDLIVDIDNVWECITGERYSKPKALNANAFSIRDLLLDMVKTRAGKWERAFIITSGAVKSLREREIELYGAEPIFIKSNKETCLQRLASCSDERKQHEAEWSSYVEKWFSDYTE